MTLRTLTLAAACTAATLAAQGQPVRTSISLDPEARAALVQTSLDDRLGALAQVGLGTSLEHDDRGDLRAIGPRWEAVFGARSVDFQPSLGTTTDQPYTLELALDTVGRRNGVARSVGQGERVVGESGQSVRYLRPTFEEIYEIQNEGLEQSFLFHELPTGAGDLVVGLTVDTELVPSLTGSSESGMEFRLDGAGGATIGGVTGIDANGARAAGWMRYESGRLELVLPAAFVDSAAMPLLLDPLLGVAEVEVTPGIYEERDADIAYDAATDTYFVVFEREVGGVFQLRGRLMDSSAAPASTVFTVRTSVVAKSDPSVASVKTRGAWVICWNEGYDILAAARSNSGVNFGGGPLPVATGADIQISPDVGGETEADDEATIVWSNLTDGKIMARQITLNPDSTVSLTGPAISLSGGSTTDAAPAISKSGGETGNHMVVWSREIAGVWQIRGAVLDRDLGVLDSFVQITTGGSVDSVSPDCDGDGVNWVVAYSQQESAGSLSYDIYARSVRLEPSGTAHVENLFGVEVSVGDHENGVRVAWAKENVLIAFVDHDPNGDDDIYLASLDPFTCQRCEGIEFLVDGDALLNRHPAIASQFGGGSDSADAFLVWEAEVISTGGSLIEGRMFRSDSGRNLDLGGDCGAGGTAYATCARTGHSAFTQRLRGGNPSTEAWLLFSFDRLDLGCGGCTLVPNPFTGFVFSAGLTDAYGDAEIAMPIPPSVSLPGLTFYEQWLTVGQNGCAPLANTEFSNAIEVRLQ